MPFDPAKPVEGTLCDAAEMRAQLTGLHALIPAGAAVDSVTTLPPGSTATATASLSGGVLHLTFDIPRGDPGEVTQAQLSNDLANSQNATMLTILPQTSSNSNAVSLLGQSAAVTYDPLQFQAMLDKVDELINTLRR